MKASLRHPLAFWLRFSKQKKGNNLVVRLVKSAFLSLLPYVLLKLPQSPSVIVSYNQLPIVELPYIGRERQNEDALMSLQFVQKCFRLVFFAHWP